MGRPWSQVVALRVAALVLLFTIAGWHEAARLSVLSSLSVADFWWHLRCGIGILETHTLLHNGLYSQSAALPWMDSAWLYDVLVAAGFRLLDLGILPLLALAAKAALAVLTFVLAGGLRGRFWPAVVLSLAAQYILGGLQPLPMFASVLLFGVELILLTEYRRRGNLRPLFWLPLLFLLWANLDVQFVYGIALLALYILATLAQESRLVDGERTGRLKGLAAIGAAALITTVVTPYGWKLYAQFFSQVTSPANAYFPDHLALRFRTPQDYVLLLLIMAAFLALGMRRSRDVFQIALLVLCMAAAFYAQRDAWLPVMASLAVLGEAIPASEAEPARPPNRSGAFQLVLASGMAVVLLVLAAVLHLPRGRAAMLAKVSLGYPVAAADYIRQHQLPQPLFNPFPWGGFLAWYLPEYPVAIDGRTELYGPEFNIQYAKAMNAEIHYSAFAPFGQAATLVFEKKSPMGKAFSGVNGFKVVYSDDVALVVVREQPGT